MFRLSKYELRKNRTALFVLLAGLAALQICFLIALRGKTAGLCNHMVNYSCFVCSSVLFCRVYFCNY